MGKATVGLILATALIGTGPALAGFVEVPVVFEKVEDSDAAWGDYDNDGDLDLLLTGLAESGPISKIYRNEEGTFTDIGAGLEGVRFGAGIWGDYDNDGDLDILLTGYASGSSRISRIYRNDGGKFKDIAAELRPMGGSSAAGGDYDNDGDLDIVLAGWYGRYTYTGVYRNDDGLFTDIRARLRGEADGSVSWGDYDNDGDLDILLTGAADHPTDDARVYRNDEGLFTDIDAGLAEVWFGPAAWGDYDNDGDLDILLTGWGGKSPGYFFSAVYRNDWGTFTDIEAQLVGVALGAVAWGDYDNDGDLDILITGNDSPHTDISLVYRNDGGTFTDIGAELDGVWHGAGIWGDYDNDGDLDILLTGLGDSENPVARLYRNDGRPANTAPGAPVQLEHSFDNGQAVALVKLDWLSATDAQTPPAGLTYNLRMGTTPGGSEIVSPMSDADTGKLRVVQPGNTNHNRNWRIILPGSGPYYWSVQAVDGMYAGSPFAPEQIIDLYPRVSRTTVPLQYGLAAATPNPFNPRTTIRYDLPRPSRVNLAVFDVAGHRVRLLVDGEMMEAGRRQAAWDGRDSHGRQVAAGVYFYRLTAGSYSETKRMVLVK